MALTPKQQRFVDPIGTLLRLPHKIKEQLSVNLPGHDMPLIKYIEYREFVIDSLNRIASDHEANKKNRDRAQFLLGCIYGYGEYVDENYNPNSVIHAQNRRSRVRDLDYTLNHTEWVETLEYFNKECVYCGSDKGTLAQDHFIPVMKQGAYTKENIVPACKTCNSSKRDRNFTDWFKTRKTCTASRVYDILSFVR